MIYSPVTFAVGWVMVGWLQVCLGHRNQCTVGRSMKRLHLGFHGMDCCPLEQLIKCANSSLLTTEGSIHQIDSYIKNLRLRLHSIHWTNPIIQARLAEPWIANPLQYIESSFDFLDLQNFHWMMSTPPRGSSGRPIG